MRKPIKSGALRPICPWIQRGIVPTLALATIALLITSCPIPDGGGETPLSSAKAITAFSFVDPPVPGTIDENAKSIAVMVPYGTIVTALVATFTTTGSTVKAGATVQVSGVTGDDFTSPIVYTVTAADGSTVHYTVTVTVSLPSDKAITALAFASPPVTGIIDESGKTILATVPNSTDVTALVAMFTITSSSVKVGSTVQVSGVTVNNFTGPLIYSVTAADGSTASYTVTVMVTPGEPARAEPEAGDTDNQAASACAVQFSVPPPALLMRSVRAGALAAPVKASITNEPGSTATCAGNAWITVSSTVTVCTGGTAKGACTVTAAV